MLYPFWACMLVAYAHVYQYAFYITLASRPFMHTEMSCGHCVQMRTTIRVLALSTSWHALYPKRVLFKRRKWNYACLNRAIQLLPRVILHAH
jgi:hypothetical protein